MNSVRPLVLAALVAVSAGAAACAAGPRSKPIPTTPITSGAGSLQQARKFLEGRWNLESFEAFPPGKEPIVLKGSGVLTYDDFGNLRIEIRTDPKTGDLLGSAGIMTQDGVISTDGRTTIDLQNKTLTYNVPGQAPARGPAGPLALSRPRYWEVDMNSLTLTTKDDNGKALSVTKWKRVQ